MGSFYCNFVLHGPSQDVVARLLADNGRSAFVSPSVRGRTIVYERDSNELDGAEIKAIGSLLSRGLDCAALAAVNADDDQLWLGLFVGGELRYEYSSRGQNRGAWAICRAFGRPWVAPLAWLVLQSPWFVFECFRHMLLATMLGIRPTWVISGYRYIEEGEPPHGLSEGEMRRTGRGGRDGVR